MVLHTQFEWMTMSNLLATKSKKSFDLRQLKPWMLSKHVIKSQCSRQSSSRSSPRRVQRSSVIVC